VPSPISVVTSWGNWFFGPDWGFRGNWASWWLSVILAAWGGLVGFAIGSVFAVTFGGLLGWFGFVRARLNPIGQGLRPIPMTAWLPFATFIFGIREGAAIFLIAMGSFFPIAVSCTIGAEQTPKNLVRAALMLGTPPRKLLVRIVLPAALPYVFNGLR